MQHGLCFATAAIWGVVGTPTVEVGGAQTLPSPESIQQGPLTVWQVEATWADCKIYDKELVWL